MSARIDLCSTAEVAPGTALRVESGGLALAVFNLDGEFYVTDDACTHGPGLLSEGFIEGEVVAPPCMVPIKTYKTVVEDGRVVIETE